VSAPIDPQGRRILNRPTDKDSLARALAEAAETLHAKFRSWPMRFLREDDLGAAERELTAMQGHLAELRAFVTTTTPPRAA
jgi:hypothetical protein